MAEWTGALELEQGPLELRRRLLQPLRLTTSQHKPSSPAGDSKVVQPPTPQNMCLWDGLEAAVFGFSHPVFSVFALL
jgi:hypothetical protein